MFNIRSLPPIERKPDGSLPRMTHSQRQRAVTLLHHPAFNDVTAYKAIEKAVEEGKVRSVGAACYYIEETEAFLPRVNIKPALIQNEILPYYQDDSVVRYIQSKDLNKDEKHDWY